MLKWCVTNGIGYGSKHFSDTEDEDVEDRPRLGDANCNFIRGSDPLMQTARGKLQTQRVKLNDQINRELRLRAGAENLFKATSNKKLRETVALELSYVNSNLQLLKEELADLNSSVLIYQNDSAVSSVPMLPLGLKETKELDFTSVFKDYLLTHYYEDSEVYERDVQDLTDIRQACRTPVRNETGVQLLYEYYNQLYFTEKRFFPPNKGLGLFFEWYDSLTGVPSSQKTVGFEKGSILFNIGALYTQIAARQDRSQLDEVDMSIDHFQRAAGIFSYLHDNFSHAPSMDMQPHTLTMLTQLMLSQAQECVLERAMLSSPPNSVHSFIQVAQEAAKVSDLYAQCHVLMRVDQLRDYVPSSWSSMVQVKSQYFKSLAHYYIVAAVIDAPDINEVTELPHLVSSVHVVVIGSATQNVSCIAPQTTQDRSNLGKAHLRESILCLEEAMRLHGLSKQLRRIDTFQVVLRGAHDRSLAQFSSLEDEDDFSELMSAPAIKSHTTTSVKPILPDFGRYKVDDLFRKLGPLAIFSSRRLWTSPREVLLDRTAGQDYGFSVRGDSPVIVAMVEDGSLASRAGMQIGDFLVAVGNRDVKWCKHEEVVQLIRAAGGHLVLQLVTPTDKNYLEAGPSSALESGSTSGLEDKRQEMNCNDKDKKEKEQEKPGSSWTLRRKAPSKDKKIKEAVNGSTAGVASR